MASVVISGGISELLLCITVDKSLALGNVLAEIRPSGLSGTNVQQAAPAAGGKVEALLCQLPSLLQAQWIAASVTCTVSPLTSVWSWPPWSNQLEGLTEWQTHMNM